MLSYILLITILFVYPFKTLFTSYKKPKKFIYKILLNKTIRQESEKKVDVEFHNVIFLAVLVTIVYLFIESLLSDNYKNNILKKVFIFSSYYENYNKSLCKNLDSNYSIAFLNKDNVSYINIKDINSSFKFSKCNN